MTRRFSFGPFVLVPAQQLLLNGEEPVRIGGRAFEILLALVERPGELISKEELLARVWPDTTIEEGNLKVNVAALRRVLGDGARYIASVTGRGYRFVAPVQLSGAEPERAHNLTLQHKLFGREDAIETVVQHTQSSRLVTLVGAGGIGKTAVAHAVAARLLPEHEHGVWFVDLAFVAEPLLVPGAIAAALQLTVHSENISAALSAFLRERTLLLVLDNCEHVIDAAASCSEMLLSNAAKVHVLATSREPLRAAGERVFRLSPLATPADAQLSAREALAFPAVELFVERAAASSGEFTLSDADAPVVAEICRKLDGLALGIELAATRMDTFSSRELLALLDDRFRQLPGHRTAPERHQTLDAALDWSYNLLTDNEQRLLRSLSTFAAPFSAESACAVAAKDPAAFTGQLAQLVAKSLVVAKVRDGSSHYRLLDTTRGYLRQKLADSGELAVLRRRHAEHLRELTTRAEAEWETRPTAEWLTLYGQKVDDIRAALAWAFEAGGNEALGVALTVAAIPFWEHLSLVEECRARAEHALDARFAAMRGERDELKLYTALGTNLLHTRGPVPNVKAAWTQALELAERLADGEYQLRCLWGLCDYHTWIGDHRAALGFVARIRELARHSRDMSASTNVDRQAGTSLRYLGELTESRRYVERMIARYVPPVFRSDTARFQLDPRSAARGTLANVLWLQGYPERALQTAERQLADARAAEHALALCNALVHSACPIALWVGDLERAAQLLTSIEAHVASHAMTVWRSMGACLRAEWLLESGDAAGLPMLRSALDQLFDTGFRMRCPAHLGALAKGFAAHSDSDTARATIDEAIDMAVASGEAWCMPELLRIKGDVLGSEDFYRRAFDLAHQQQASSWKLRAAISIAELRHDEKSERLLSTTYASFSEGLETRDLQRARALLAQLRSPRDYSHHN